MPRYLYKASYTVDGARGIQREGGTKRRETVAAIAESVGGRVESFDFAFGEDDVYIIVELPDNETAVSLAVAVNASGAVKTSTVVLMTPEELDAAAKRSVEYRPPGG